MAMNGNPVNARPGRSLICRVHFHLGAQYHGLPLPAVLRILPMRVLSPIPGVVVIPPGLTDRHIQRVSC
jgi:hypothetical protein